MVRKKKKTASCRKYLIFCALVLMVTAVTCNCGKKDNSIEKQFDFKVVRTLSADEPDSPYFFARILDVCANSKYIYVSDWKRYCIKMFDHNFNFIKQIGQKGEGPGEFGQIFVNMTCNEKHLYLITVNRLYTLSVDGHFIKETILKFMPGQLFLLPEGFLFKRNSPGDVFALTDTRGNTINTFFKAPIAATKHCGKITAEPHAFLTSNKELLIMDSLKYKIDTLDLSTKKIKTLLTRDVDFLGLKCTKNKDGEQVFEGGYSWMLEGGRYIYYFYFNSGKQLKMDVFSLPGGNGFELKSTGKCTGTFHPLCIIPDSDRFVGIFPDESHILYECGLSETPL